MSFGPEVFAAAGGGSSAFGGGFHGGGGFGGGGFGGGGGHGHGIAIYLLLRVLIDIALIGHGAGAAVLVLLAGLAWGYLWLLPRMRAAAREHRAQGRRAGSATRARSRRVELAAAEASELDPAFAPDAVQRAAAELWADVQSAWDRRDTAALARLLTPGLLPDWERRLRDFARRGWHNRVEPTEPPQITYVGLRGAGAGPGGRVVVRIDGRLRDYVVDARGRHIRRRGRATETVRTREFWTLERVVGGDGAGAWRLARIESGAEGAHALADQVIATPWADSGALRDEALTEQAVAEALPGDVTPAEVAGSSVSGGDARAAALDLSLVDGRFAPDVIEVAVRRVVAAWERAVDGDLAPLAALAEPAAVSDLAGPASGTRVVVRGLHVEGVRIAELDVAHEPALVRAEVALRGRRYAEDRATAGVLEGTPLRDTSFTEPMTFALSEDTASPWRLRSARAARTLA